MAAPGHRDRVRPPSGRGAGQSRRAAAALARGSTPPLRGQAPDPWPGTPDGRAAALARGSTPPPRGQAPDPWPGTPRWPGGPRDFVARAVALLTEAGDRRWPAAKLDDLRA